MPCSSRKRSSGSVTTSGSRGFAAASSCVRTMSSSAIAIGVPARPSMDAGELMLSPGGEQRILVVGHNREFVQVVYAVTGAGIELKKGGIAAIREGHLIVLLRPRELDRICGD